MTAESKVELEFRSKFSSGPMVKFANEEEFFEALGILCRADGSTDISGRKTDRMGFHVYGEIYEGLEGLESLALDGDYTYDITSPVIKCMPEIYYTKAFFDLFKDHSKTNKIACASFVKYLILGFGFDRYVQEHNNVMKVRPPSPEDMREIIQSKGLGQYLYFFNKGLAGQ